MLSEGRPARGTETQATKAFKGGQLCLWGLQQSAGWVCGEQWRYLQATSLPGSAGDTHTDNKFSRGQSQKTRHSRFDSLDLSREGRDNAR